MLSFLLGAGFSKWAVGLPVAEELFDFDFRPDNSREAKRLERIQKMKLSWDIYNPNAHAEEFIAYALQQDIRTQSDVLWYVTRRLSEPFIWREYTVWRCRRHVLMVDEYRALRIGRIEQIRYFFQGCSSLSGIITTNYDLIPEYALGSRGFNYGVIGHSLIGRGAYPVSQWRSPVVVTGRIPLAKVHGSISWDRYSKYTDGRRGITGNALIIPPVQEKVPPPELEQVWELARQILSKSKTLIVFGYSFSDYDEVMLDFLRDVGGNIEYVLDVDIESRLSQICSIWPHAGVSFCHVDSFSNNVVHEWLKSRSA